MNEQKYNLMVVMFNSNAKAQFYDYRYNMVFSLNVINVLFSVTSETGIVFFNFNSKIIKT